MTTQTPPVCWCGDPGTYALDAMHPAGIGSDEQRWVWSTHDTEHLVVTRCRAHAGPFSSEVTRGALTPVRLYPIDTGPCCECDDRWTPCGCGCHA